MRMPKGPNKKFDLVKVPDSGCQLYVQNESCGSEANVDAAGNFENIAF